MRDLMKVSSLDTQTLTMQAILMTPTPLGEMYSDEQQTIQLAE